MTKTGRPAGAGDRYPCGKLKDTTRGEAAYNRLKHAPSDIKALFDPLLGSALGRLSPYFLAELTWTQVEAGKAVGRIYGQFEHLIGAKSRSAPSPSYQRAYAKAFDLNQTAAEIMRTQRRFDEVQAVFAELPAIDQGRARDVIEGLCVDDRQPAAANLVSIRAMLNRIAFKLRITDSEGPGIAIAVAARQPPRVSPAKLARAASDREAYALAHRKLGWTDAAVERGWHAYQQARALTTAKHDRATFRRDKAAAANVACE